MIRVALRMHRLQLAILFAAVAALSVCVVLSEAHAASEVNSLHHLGCSPSSLSVVPVSTACSQLMGEYFSIGRPSSVIALIGLYLPGIVGVIVGVSLITREMEAGTFRIAWTQSISRKSWLIGKLIVVGSGVGLAMAVFAVVMNRWVHVVTPLTLSQSSGPLAHPPLYEQASNLSPGISEISGVVFVAYGLCAFAIGALAGALIHKTGIAIAAALGGFIAVREFVVYHLRPGFLPPLTMDAKDAYLSQPSGAWPIHAGFLQLGRTSPAPGRAWNNDLPNGPCSSIMSPHITVGVTYPEPHSVINQFTSCLRGMGLHYVVAYQPASRFWAFQSIETAILVVITALSIGATLLAVKYASTADIAGLSVWRWAGHSRRARSEKELAAPSRPVVVSIAATSAIVIGAACTLVLNWQQTPVASTSYSSPLHWAAPMYVDPGKYRPFPELVDNIALGPSANSCPSSSFCAAVDARGNVLTFNGMSWSRLSHVIDGKFGPALSCASSTFCAVVGSLSATLPDGTVHSQGEAAIFDGLRWSSRATVDDGSSLDSVSCAVSKFCIASDDVGRVTIFNGGSWSVPEKIGTSGRGHMSLSCTSKLFCVAIGPDGQTYVWDGAAWSAEGQTAYDVSAVSLSCTSTTFCIAIDGSGSFRRFNGATWTRARPLDKSYTGGLSPTMMGVSRQIVSCVSPTFCVVATPGGDAFTFDGSNWSAPRYFDRNMVRSISCASTGFCMAIDVSGNVVEGRS